MLNVDGPSHRAQALRGACLKGNFAVGWRSLGEYRPRFICFLVLAALSNLYGCGQVPSKPVRSSVPRDSPVASSLPPTINPPHAKSDRVISVHGVDTEYHGATAILPDNRLDHQKGSHD
ncbi:MAG: hypothetical protein U0941_25865 [Planctomycetaceae bacterium]